jgi:heme-degrading monooxygenase HmoA
MRVKETDDESQLASLSAPWKRIVNETWEAVINKPGGPLRLSWSLEDKDKSRVWSFFDWNSVEQHKAFAQEHGEEVVKGLSQVCNFEEHSKHVDMRPSSDPLKPFCAEVFSVYFPKDIDETGQDRVTAELEDKIRKTFHDAPGYAGGAFGWGLENSFIVKGDEGKPGPKMERENEKETPDFDADKKKEAEEKTSDANAKATGGEKKSGTAAMAFVGWESLEAKTAFQKTDAYKEFVDVARNIDGMIGYYDCTISFEHMKRGQV